MPHVTNTIQPADTASAQHSHAVLQGALTSVMVQDTLAIAASADGDTNGESKEEDGGLLIDYSNCF